MTVADVMRIKEQVFTSSYVLYENFKYGLRGSNDAEDAEDDADEDAEDDAESEHAALDDTVDEAHCVELEALPPFDVTSVVASIEEENHAVNRPP